MMRLLFSCFLMLFFCGSAYSKTAKPIVVLLSIDGFAYEYLHKYQPANILALSKAGVVAKLQSVYPSKTFPNHLSIITGTYPIHHGIVNNVFYSPELDQQYTLGAGKNNAAWLKADPLWTVAEQQGLKTAVYFWPESEALEKQPSYNIAFNRTDSNKDRFDQIIKWLALPTEQRPQFIVSYFSSIDSAGHTFGPNSNEVAQAIEDIDLLLGEFVTKLASEIADNINIVIVSDHGMLPKDNTKVIKPSMVFDDLIIDLVKTKAITVASNDTQLYLYFTHSTLSEIERANITQRLIVQAASNQNKNLYHLYAKGRYPKHWQFNPENSNKNKNNNAALVPDMIFEAISPATFTKEEFDIKTSNKGTHGYDAINQKDLLGIFIALGPDITQGKEVLTFENIHVFPFLSDLLAIKQPITIDGTGEMLMQYIKTK